MKGKSYFSISSISFSKSSGLATGGKRLIVLPSFEMRNLVKFSNVLRHPCAPLICSGCPPFSSQSRLGRCYRNFVEVYFKTNIITLDEERNVKSTSGFDIEVVPVWKWVLRGV